MAEPEDEDQERLRPVSMTPMDSRYAALRDLVPEAFAEGELDLRSLGAALGLTGPPESERYCLSWPGKHAAGAIRQERSIGTLRPDGRSGHGPPDAPDVVIEGDNLEVLKLPPEVVLQPGQDDFSSTRRTTPAISSSTPTTSVRVWPTISVLLAKSTATAKS